MRESGKSIFNFMYINEVPHNFFFCIHVKFPCFSCIIAAIKIAAKCQVSFFFTANKKVVSGFSTAMKIAVKCNNITTSLKW